jgi:molecular chaperone GrpE
MTQDASQKKLHPGEDEEQSVSEEIFSGEPEAVGEDSAPDPLEVLKEENAKLKDMYLRAMAETENVRARAKRDIEDSSRYAATKFARDMVNIIENLGRASASITPELRASGDVLKQVGDGIDMTMQELLGIFERNGIKRLNPQGEKFDHNFHQAVAQVETKDAPAGTVLQVLQAGYLLHDRLLRPAMVTVAKQPSKPAAVDTTA